MSESGEFCVSARTGGLLDACHFPVPAPAITLMDLNPNTLEVAARRLRRYAPNVSQANVLEPWPLPPASFDSVGMCHLLHCLPGTLVEKAVVFEYAHEVLAPGGVVFGATLPGQGVGSTWIARHAITASNRRGVMCNLDDRLEDLDAALAHTFASHEISVVGSVALFSGRVPTDAPRSGEHEPA